MRCAALGVWAEVSREKSTDENSLGALGFAKAPRAVSQE